MTTLKEVLSILGLIGVPSFGVIVGWLAKSIKSQRVRQEALEKGVQAMLRTQMINDYNKWCVEKNFAPIWVKDNFENVWKQYEALWENGVMDGIHDEFMLLPTEPHKKKETKDE